MAHSELAWYAMFFASVLVAIGAFDAGVEALGIIASGVMLCAGVVMLWLGSQR